MLSQVTSFRDDFVPCRDSPQLRPVIIYQDRFIVPTFYNKLFSVIDGSFWLHRTERSLLTIYHRVNPNLGNSNPPRNLKSNGGSQIEYTARNCSNRGFSEKLPTSSSSMISYQLEMSRNKGIIKRLMNHKFYNWAEAFQVILGKYNLSKFLYWGPIWGLKIKSNNGALYVGMFIIMRRIFMW